MVSEQVKIASKRTYLKYRLEHKARTLVHQAISCGKLTKQGCEECGDAKAEAHHDDYNKPLEVRWLCSKCHKKWHRNNDPIRPKAERKCIICGKIFTQGNELRKFCSLECQHERKLQFYRAATKRVTEREREARKDFKKECIVCGMMFHPEKTSMQKYCSRECWKVVRSQQKKAEYQRNIEQYRQYRKRILADPVKRAKKQEQDRAYREKKRAERAVENLTKKEEKKA